jgi:hypothetical protein
MNPMFLLGFERTFHGTGNSAWLCQNLGILGVLKPPNPMTVRYWFHPKTSFTIVMFVYNIPPSLLVSVNLSIENLYRTTQPKHLFLFNFNFFNFCENENYFVLQERHQLGHHIHQRTRHLNNSVCPLPPEINTHFAVVKFCTKFHPPYTKEVECSFLQKSGKDWGHNPSDNTVISSALKT